jgi:hypothetical protein
MHVCDALMMEPPMGQGLGVAVGGVHVLTLRPLPTLNAVDWRKQRVCKRL